DTAEYFSKIVDHFAITDIGTSASLRSFAVYDLTIRKQIFSGSYVDGQINITDRSVTYWTPTNITPTLQNCPQYNEWYHSAVIASEMSLSFPDIKNTDLGTKRCFYQE
ncbi:MAG: hypothetical protein KGI66_05085, partial [Patescibacteria group bacterium]|nr:hypothetical protein [Patescibacteria group bacterium]